MSFGVAENFRWGDRKKIIKSHYDVLKDRGITFIRVPHSNCIPFRIYELILKPTRRDAVECYQYSMSEFRKIVSDCDIQNYFSSVVRALKLITPFHFMKEERDLSKIFQKLIRRNLPLLTNVLVEKLLSLLKKNECGTQAYADE